MINLQQVNPLLVASLRAAMALDYGLHALFSTATL